MRRRLHIACGLVLSLAALGCSSAGERDAADATAEETPAGLNQLSADEPAEGWQLLFDGETLAGWRGYRRDHVPDSWQVVEGAIRFAAEGERGYIITESQFDDFELSIEWKISEAGNSGIFYRAIEHDGNIWELAPEMQVVDNVGHPDGKNPLWNAGANYALHAPRVDVTKPAGEWNHARLLVQGNHVEHWLNGEKLLEYELGSDEWKSLVASSKFAEWPGYGMNQRGHIGLQDHDDEVWYRNIKIRSLSPG